MKNYILLILIISFLGCSSSKNNFNKSDWDKENLFGKIKTLKTTFLKSDKQKKNILTFNKQGFLLSEKELVKGGFQLKVLNKYDDKNNISFKTDFKTKDTTVTRYQYIYNKKDSLIKYTEIIDEYLKEVSAIRNKNNRVTKLIIKYNDTLNAYKIYNYDKWGNIIKENLYHKDNSPIKLISRVYNKYHLLSEQIKRDFIDDFNFENIYIYDKKKRLVTIKSHFIDSSNLTLISYKYDKNSNLIAKEDKPIGSKHFKIKNYKWDEFGNLIEEISTDNMQGILFHFRFKYKYDQFNNWIFKEKFNKSKSIYIVKREIEYY